LFFERENNTNTLLREISSENDVIKNHILLVTLEYRTSQTHQFLYSYTNKRRLYIDVYVLLSTYSQKTFPYHVVGVDSNDVLFGGSIEYRNQVQDLLSSCVVQLREQLNALEGKPSQSRCALTLLSEMTGRLIVTVPICEFYGILLRYILTGRAALKGVYRLHSTALLRLRDVITVQLGEDRGAGIGPGVGPGVGLVAGTGTGTGTGSENGVSYLCSLLSDVEKCMLTVEGGR
jgi:hypothetical protein